VNGYLRDGRNLTSLLRLAGFPFPTFRLAGTIDQGQGCRGSGGTSEDTKVRRTLTEGKLSVQHDGIVGRWEIGLLAVACLAILAAPVAGYAQAITGIEDVEVAIWPEYDRPQALVIYRVTLPEDVDLPTTIAVPIPAKVGEPHAVAMRGPEGGLLMAPYRLQVEGGWATVFVEADSPDVQVEYYDALQIEGDRRDFTFNWPEGFPAGDVRYEIQQPLGAEELQVEPPPEEEGVGADGLQYAWGDMGAVSAASSFTIEFSYSKADGGLTADQIQPSSPGLSRPEATSGATPDLTQIFPWVMGALGLLLVGTGAYLYFRARSAAGRKRAFVPRRRRSRREGPTSEGDVSKVFCHVCGNRAGVGDRFCRHCGARLRG
jgi:hypothetical protein